MSLAAFALSVLASVIGSGLTVVVWFHYDLEGWWEHRRHARMMRLGARRDTMSG